MTVAQALVDLRRAGLALQETARRALTPPVLPKAPSVSAIPATSLQTGGVAPWSAVQVARRVMLGLFTSMPPVGGMTSVTIAWDTVISQAGGLFTLAAPTLITIPAAWEGGGLLLTGFLRGISTPGDCILPYLVKNGLTAPFYFDGSCNVVNAAGEFFAAVTFMDPEPAPGDSYVFDVSDQDGGNPGITGSAPAPPGTGGFWSGLLARQVFPL